MGCLLVDYFSNIFFESNGDYSSVVALLKPVVTSRDNDALLAPFSVDDFYRAVFQMHPEKAPRPDDMNSAFFQK